MKHPNVLHSLSRLVLVAGMGLTLAVAPAGAQRLTDTRTAVSAAAAHHPGPLVVPSEKQTPLWPFVVGGTVVGAAAGVLWLALEISRSEDPFVFPMYWVIAGGGGAIIGGLVGLAVGVIVRDSRR